MTATSPPFRIENDIYQAAKATAAKMHRSAAQQLAYWARIGRELESSDSLSHRDITAVLAGDKPYDSLPAREQAVVRAEWVELIDDRIGKLDLTSHFSARNEEFVDIDGDGRVIRYQSDGSNEVISEADASE